MIVINLNVFEKDVWQILSESDKPVVIYGMGNGADKIMSILDDYNIKVSAVFASDNFVRGHSFHGFKVEKYSDICARFDDFNVVLSFATNIKSVVDNIQLINEEHNVYAPDVPIVGGGLFTKEYFEKNKEKFEQVYSVLADSESKRVYENILNYKISGKLKYLFDSMLCDKSCVYSDILKLSCNETIVDLGAYDGDTIKEFTTFTNDNYRHIYALEPDEKNYKKLVKNTGELKNITTYNMGAWNKKDTLFFAKKAGRNSKFSYEGVPVKVTDIDSLIDDEVSMIKMDIEGSEMNALKGAENIIKKYAPKLYVCAYHRNEDLFAIPLKILQLNENYKIYFRHSYYIPAWESNFYCVVD